MQRTIKLPIGLQLKYLSLLVFVITIFQLIYVHLYSTSNHDAISTLNSSKVSNVSKQDPSDYSLRQPFFNHTIVNGCAPFHHNNELLSIKFHSAPFIRTERQLVHAYSEFRSSFIPLPHFDTHESIGGVAQFTNAYVNGEHSIVFDCRFIYAPGGCWEETVSKDEFLIDHVLQSQSTMQHIESAVLIAQYWGDGFYHFMIEDIPRISLLHTYLLENPQVQILSYTQHLKWHIMLTLLGIDPIRIVSYSSTVFVRHLLVPTATRCGRGNPAMLKRFRDIVRHNIPVMWGDKLKEFKEKYRIQDADVRVIVVQYRGNGWKRSISNHDELIDALESELNIDSNRVVVLIHNGEMSAEESILMHYVADVIIGPHGAGLSLTIFAPQGVGYIELHPLHGNYNGNEPNICHRVTAIALGARESYLIQSTGNAWTPFKIDVESVLSIVKQLLFISNHNVLPNVS